MASFFFRLTKTMFGFVLFAIGIMLMIQANIGYAPWDVFHVGLAKTLGITIGMASISTGFVIIILCLFLRETLGLGTILNMFFVGFFVDIINHMNIIPPAGSVVMGYAMMLLALIIMAFASYFYISGGFGAGPRDSLMVSLSRKSGLSIGLCRIFLEFVATVFGYFLGGMVGLGTLVFVILIGVFVELVFRLLKFDPRKIHHETLKESLGHFVTKAS